MVSRTAPITSSLPYACAPFRRGYDHRPDLLFHSVRAGSSPRRRPRLSAPPPTYAHTILLGGNYKGASAEGSRGGRERRCTAGRQTAEKLSRGGVKIIRRRINYPGRARVDQNSKKKISKCLKLSHSAENTLFHIFIHWAELYPIFIHWTKLYPIFIHWTDLYPILIHWTKLYPMLIHWAELYPILIHWAELYPIFIHWTELYPIFIHWTDLYPILIHWTELYPMLIHWAELYPILIHWTELYPMLIHWAELYPILIHWTELYPILIHWAELYPILIH